MTSESKGDERQKLLLRIQRFIQRNKPIIFVFVGATVLATVYIIPPDPTKISCNDPSIRKPYYPDTISGTLLVASGIILPFITMTILEWALPCKTRNQENLFQQALHRTWLYISDLIVGGLVMYMFNDLAKTSSSEARPNFWSLCSPNFTDEQCKQKYITVSWKDCTNPLNLPKRKMSDSMKSFPSGHASVSVFAALFMFVYLQQRKVIWKNRFCFLAPLMQLLWSVWAFMCCITRISDNKHHWWDVLFGASLGAVGAVLTVIFFSNCFRRDEEEDTGASKLPETTTCTPPVHKTT